MRTFKVGQILTLTEPVVKNYDTGKTKVYPRGTKVQVRADHALQYEDGSVQYLSDRFFRLKGYDARGLAQAVLESLHTNFPLEALAYDYEIEDSAFLDVMQDALEAFLVEDDDDILAGQ